MSEVLTELVAKITTDAAGLKSGLSDAENQIEASSKRMQDSLKKVGTVMAASGAAITAALGFMGKAAIDEEINIKRLATTINNSGTAYDNVKDSLEAVISATQRKTGIADNEQRDVLNRLILVTNDYGKALELLPTALDLAVAGEMDAAAAATYLGKAYLDLENGAESVSVRFGQASLQFKNMADIQGRVIGQAEALANPLNILKASISDVAEAIGTNLLPLIKDATNWMVDIAIKVKAWVEENPELASTLTKVALALGVVLTVAGGLILILPTLISGVAAFGVVFHAALGPIGLISLAIAGLITAGILLWKNWDGVWSNMKNAALHAVDVILAGLEKFMGWIPVLGDKIRSARDAIANMIDSEKVKRDIRDLERDLGKLTETVKSEYGKQRDEITKRYDSERIEAKKAFDTTVDLINKEYGIVKDDKVGETRIDKAKAVTEALKEQYKKESEAAKTRYDKEISELDKVYDAKIKTINAEANARTQALQLQIDAIDEQTAKEELSLTRQAEKARIIELQRALGSAETWEAAAKAEQELDEYTTQVKRNELLRQRADEKDQLRNEIQNIRDSLQSEKDRLAEGLEAQKSKLQEEYDLKIETWKLLDEQSAKDLETQLARIETDRLAKINSEKVKLDTELLRLDTAEKADIQFYVDQLKRTNQQIADINIAYNALTKRYDIEIVTHQITVYESSGSLGGISSGIATQSHAGIPSFDSGGIVPGPIGMPQLAMVHGGETVIPANESMGNVVVNFSQPVFFDREDTMNRFVDMISKGIDRKQRLRFGGAYNGG